MVPLDRMNLLLLLVREGRHYEHHRQAEDGSDIYSFTVLQLEATVQMWAE